ncbi:MAG: peptidylprolyl isomerase [Candidatus Bathyarchaeota archaeon]|nr:peptidylprolyl isomerase [Candidatus Bathyarchaeota archaeon]
MAPKTYYQARKRKSNTALWVAIAIVVLAIAAFGAYTLIANQPKPTKVLLETTAGNIIIELRTDKPITTSNFINLVKAGKYDGTTFHRIVAGFMIQGGQVNGQVDQIKDEIGSNNRNTPYTIAMAKTSQPNSATSQFFINVVDNGQKYSQSGFDSTYTVFGKVIEGKDVVDAIANAPATENPYIPGEISVPVNPVVVTKASILP